MLRPLFLILILFIVSGCSGENCYDADDFGFANLVVTSRYTKEEMENQQGENQVAPWINSTYRVNGRPLAILVKHWDYETNKNSISEVSAWCPWFGDIGNENKLSDFCHRLQDCLFIDNNMCTNTPDARISNAPCIMRKGVGLYALISEKGNDPNISLSSMKQPDGISFHLGVPPSGYTMFDIAKNGEIKEAGGRVYLYDNGSVSPDSLKSTYSDGPLYFKILDKYYDDNSGQYRVSIKSGVHVVNPDPISYVIRLVKEFMFGTGGDDYGLIQRIYQGVIDNEGYRLAVSALLTLYIMYTGMAYLTGNIELSNTELIMRVGKIAIISALISTERSWTFFYDYLFAFFVGGVEQILQMIMAAGASGPGASGILAMMIAPQTMAKLFSLLFVDWRGFIYIILFLLALFFVIKVFFDAAVIYLTALLAIGLIIVMAPIFICFLLFSFTRSLFENWLRQLVSYAIQPIILFTGLVFISFIIREEIYGSLGFRVCKHFIPELSEEADIFGGLSEEILGVNIGRSPFYWWFPEPMKGEYFNRNMVTIPIPIDHFDTNGDLCEAYGCFGERYPDLPFLDPNTDRGAARISKFHNGEFVQLDGLLLIFLAIYLLSKFNTLTISMAKFIAGTSGSFTDIGSVPQRGLYGGSHSFRSFGKVMGREFRRTDLGRRAHGYHAAYKEKKKEFKKLPDKYIDKRMIKRLEKQALSSDATKSVLQEVENTTGLRQSDVIAGSSKRYQEALAQRLIEMDGTLTKSHALEIAKKMSNTNYKKMHEEFARAKYGKEFKDLNSQQQAELKAMMNKEFNSNGNIKSLRELAIDAKNEKRFRQAYVDAHQDMSHRGVGLFGKHSTVIRSFDEFQNKYKTAKKDRKSDRKMRGERIMSGYEGIKSSIYGNLTGEDDNGRDLGKKFFGGGYHDIDRKDPALRTYDETLKEQRRAKESDKIDRKIAAVSEREGTNVISPEFLAERKYLLDEKFENYQALANQNIKSQVHKEIANGKNPILKGDKYMWNYAKDSELVEMVDRAQLLKEEMFEKDQFISREDSYEIRLEKAKEAIAKDIETYGDAFEDGIDPEKMPEQLRKYLMEQAEEEAKNLGIDPSEIDQDDINYQVENLRNNLAEYQYTQQVLEQIDERKLMIVEEIDQEISRINEARVASGMEEYYGEAENQYTVRDIRKIEDHLKSAAIGSSALTGGVGSPSSAIESGNDKQKDDPAKNGQKIREQEKKETRQQVKEEQKQQQLAQKAYEDALKAQQQEQQRRDLEGKMKEEEKKSKQQAPVDQNVINDQDSGYRTNAEISRAEKSYVARQDLDKRINELNKEKGEDVISPQFLAANQNDKNIALYKDIAKYTLEDDVNRALTTGDDPALKGQTYLREYSSEEEFANMVDRARSMENTLMEQDKYIRQEREYETKAAMSQTAIQFTYNMYIQAFDSSDNMDINYVSNDQSLNRTPDVDKMPEQLERYLTQMGMNRSEVREKVDKLNENIQTYQESQQVLQQIDERKKLIVDTIDNKIIQANEVRSEAGMAEYQGKKTEYQPREERTIEDFLRHSDSPFSPSARESQSASREFDNAFGQNQERTISPEFLANHLDDRNIEEYIEIARKEIEDQVHRDLTTGDNPVIKDQQYMRESASDAELANMIDRVAEYESTMLQQDPFINQEAGYELRVEQAEKAIEQSFLEYRDAFGAKITPDKMPEQLHSYLTKQGMDQTQVKEQVDNLQDSLEQYNHNQQVLQQIDNRKEMVASEINKEIAKINDIRKESGMQEHNRPNQSKSSTAPQNIKIGQKSLTKKDLKTNYRERHERKIEDYLRKKDK